METASNKRSTLPSLFYLPHRRRPPLCEVTTSIVDSSFFPKVEEVSNRIVTTSLSKQTKKKGFVAVGNDSPTGPEVVQGI